VLDAAQRRRHARHLLLVEIGEAGQSRLCATRVAVSDGADAAARAVAEDYARRAGLALASEADAELALPDAAAIDALAGRAELRHAAAALAGAFAAVEAIKRALALGAAAELPAGLCLGEEPA
jgi:hypothetical protein